MKLESVDSLSRDGDSDQERGERGVRVAQVNFRAGWQLVVKLMKLTSSAGAQEATLLKSSILRRRCRGIVPVYDCDVDCSM